jgi:hypothetical protein
MKRFLFENGLTLFFLTILLLALAGQSVAGLAEFNNQQITSGLQTMSYGQYLVSSDFAVDVAENWQSEFLQFTLYVFATVWLVQRGSSESKEPDKVGPESDEDQLIGQHAQPDSSGLGRRRRAPAGAVLPIPRDHHGQHLPAVVAGAIHRRAGGVQRPTAQPAAGPGELVRLHHLRRLLEPDPAELAVRVPRRRRDGDLRGLPATARIPRIQAGRGIPQHDRSGRLSLTPQRRDAAIQSSTRFGMPHTGAEVTATWKAANAHPKADRPTAQRLPTILCLITV